MGSICSINRNPKTWPAYLSGKKLKPEYGGEDLMAITYGFFDDDLRAFDMEMYMRKSIYDKCISGEYRIRRDSSTMRRLIVIDKHGTEVKPIASDFCY